MRFSVADLITTLCSEFRMVTVVGLQFRVCRNDGLGAFQAN